jgi:hypothetical protein
VLPFYLTKARAAPTARKAELQAALRQLCQGAGCSQAVALHAFLVHSGDVALAQQCYLASSSDGSPP